MLITCLSSANQQYVQLISLSFELQIIIIPLFTLGSIYSTYASGAEQMTETNNQIYSSITGLRFPTGRSQTRSNLQARAGLDSAPANCKSSGLTLPPREAETSLWQN